MKIYRLNVSRAKAGKLIPFDRVYLAKNDAKKMLKALFSYAIVMPVVEPLHGMLKALKPIHVTDPSKRENSDNWSALMESSDPLIAVIPILPRRARELMPSYLLNRKWIYTVARDKRKPENPFPVLSYLQTPTENFRPVCVACPRFNEHMAGKCNLGQKICYETLVLGQVEPLPDEYSASDVRESENWEIP